MLAGEEVKCGVLLWDVELRTQIGAPIHLNGGLIECLSFSQDGSMLAIGFATAISPGKEKEKQDVGFICFDVKRGKQIARPHTQHPADKQPMMWFTEGLSFSYDGRVLAQSLRDHTGATVVLWDTQKWTQLGQPLNLKQPDCVDVDVSFHPRDSNLLAVLFKKYKGKERVGNIMFWDVSARKKLGKELIDSTIPIGRILFSPDGTYLAATTKDAVLLWEMGEGYLVRRARRIVGRNLSWTEWEQFIGAGIPYRRVFMELPLWDGVAEALKAGMATLDTTHR